MKIVLHIISGLNVGGAEMMLYKLISGMDRKRFNSSVISLTGQGPVSKQIESLGVPVYSLELKPGFSALTVFLRLIRKVRGIRPDIIQGWMYHGNLAAQIAAAFLSNVPVIWNIRQSLYQLRDEKTLTAAVIWLGAKLSGLPVRIIYNSHTSALQHEHYGYRAEKTLIIPNGFNTDVFVPDVEARLMVRRELGLSGDALLIGLIGRYHPMKDHGNFLQAVALLVENFPQVHFVLAGSGIDNTNKMLTGQIAGLGITANVHLLGERSDIARLTAALDIATSSSYSEAFPNVIGEAMSCGVPCVVTDVGDSAWITGDTGRAVPPKDPEALAGAWMELIHFGAVKRQKLGAAARKRIIGNFSLKSVASQYEALYEQVLTKV